MAEGNGKRKAVASALLLTQFLVLFQSTLGQSGSCSASVPCPTTGDCCSKFNFCGSTSEYCSAENCLFQCPNSSSPAPPSSPSGSGVGSIATSDFYNNLFPSRNAFYTYDSFISAAASFPAFGTTGDATAQATEIAAFFAHVSHETGGLSQINEISPLTNYCDTTSTQYPCASGQSYYGRGPLQLSWNYNYGPAGSAIGEDLLGNPNLVAQDAVVSWKTAFWFWNTAQNPKPSSHDAILGIWTPTSVDIAAGRRPGFGVTIDIINGGIECGPNATNAAAANNRVDLFTSIAATLKVSTGDFVGCANMQPFPV